MRFAGVVMRGIGTLVVAAVAVAPVQAQAKPATKPAATAPAPAPAQSGATKLAFVNARRILQSTPGWTTAEQTFTKESEGYRAELQKLQATLDSMASEYEQQSVVLSPTQRQAKRTELETKRTAARDARAGAAAEGTGSRDRAARAAAAEGERRHRGDAGGGQLRLHLRREHAGRQHRGGRPVP